MTLLSEAHCGGSTADDRPVGAALHILHAVLRLDVGGLERMVVDLACLARKQGHRVTVLCLECPGVLAAQAEADGVKVLSLGKRPGRDAHLFERVSRLLQDLAPDVVHTHQIGALWYVGNAAEAVPVLHTEHTDSAALAVGWYRKLRMRVLCRMATRNAASVLCVSDAVARSSGRWGTVPRAKLRVVPNGIQPSRYAFAGSAAGQATRRELGIAPGAVVVGTVGRLHEVKRQDLLLRAVAGLGSQRTMPHVLLVGDGPERDRLTRLASKLNIADRTYFAGYQASPVRFLAAMDAFVLSSRLEGLPVSMLEAWASRLPVIATAVGGIPSLVASGVNGLLVPPGNPVALGRAIDRVLSDAPFALSIAAAGEATVRDRYSLHGMARAYELLYREAIDTCRRA